MTLPEVTGFPDFIVEKTRYVAAMEKKWSCRDKCKVWWKNDGDGDGSWWDGRVVQIQPKSTEFPDSPWEMCTVLYKTVPKETQLHSPWELFATNTIWVQPQIDDKIKTKLHSAFAQLVKSASSRQDSLGINKLNQLQEKPKFTNWCAVPISLDLIQSRLENNYYRNSEALKHDFKEALKHDFSLC